MKQPTEPTGDPLDYRCPSCGLFPGQRCVTSRGKAHKRRVEVANGTRRMAPDDAPDPNKWLKDFIGQALAEQEAQARSRARKARLMASVR
jgi:hypothetical protein